MEARESSRQEIAEKLDEMWRDLFMSGEFFGCHDCEVVAGLEDAE